MEHLFTLAAGTIAAIAANKVKALDSDEPEIIATANVGCLTHIESGSATLVRHWIELLADRL